MDIIKIVLSAGIQTGSHFSTSVWLSRGLRIVLPLLCGLCLASCAHVTLPETATLGGKTQGVLASADSRLITERGNPADPHNVYPNIICTEPSPDVALALTQAIQLSGGAGGSAGPSGSLGYSSSQALTALAGRSSALLGLRDVLYKACEAYANGIIGKEAYALILSQYGDILVTLMLGQDASDAPPAPAAVAAAADTATEGTPSKEATTQATGTSPSTTTTVTTTTEPTPTKALPAKTTTTKTTSIKTVTATTTPPPATTTTKTETTKEVTTTPPTSTSTTKTSSIETASTETPPQTKTATPPVTGKTAGQGNSANSIAQMYTAYWSPAAINARLVGSIFVSCVTLAEQNASKPNAYLGDFCKKFGWEAIEKYITIPSLPSK